MASLTIALYVSLSLLAIDSIIELAFISSMVSWLHNRAGKDFFVNYNSSTFPLHGKPEHFLLDQGHTSNGAAGTAFILIGLGGALALFLRSNNGPRLRKLSLGWYHFWLSMTILSTLLTLAALIYTFILTNNHDGQIIDIAAAASLDNHPYPDYVAYPLLEWTPENWFDAVLDLPLASDSDRSDIRSHLRIMRGWRWNLIPMFILGLAVSALAVVEALQRRKRYAAVPKRETESA